MIIDFRMRPPARGFLNIGVYDDVARTAKLTECFSMKQAPSVAQKSPELMLQEMDTAGVTMGVIPGRNGHFKGSISNDDIISLLGDFPGRFVGMAGLNASKREESLEEIHRTVLNGPLKGICMEPGALDKPMYADDPRIYPIYDLCNIASRHPDARRPGRAGHHLQRSQDHQPHRRRLPEDQLHHFAGGWPWVQQILGVCFFQKNIYLCPDMYLFNCSGAADYIMAANNFMQDRFLFGTAYPLMPIGLREHFKGLFKPEVLPKLLYKNAAKLLNIELPEEA
ncbi:MAG: amidohydrolase family protein [Bilophila wadsworthia]